MSTHTVSELNALQAGLHQRTRTKNQNTIQRWIASHFIEGDLFVTLTYEPYTVRNEVERTTDVRIFLRKLNTKLFGRAYKKGHIKLKVMPIFEVNKKDGLHVHFLIGKPKLSKSQDMTIDEIIKSIWCEMRFGGVVKAQDSRDVTDVVRLMSYLTKQVTSTNKLLNIDWLNANWS